MSNIRVLHCPTNTGGNPYGLARAERELGLRSWSVAFERHPFHYPVDEMLFCDADSVFSREVRRWRFLWRAIRDFDLIHFNFGQSITRQGILKTQIPQGGARSIVWQMYRHYTLLFELRDLPLIKKGGKGIVVTYQGDDARQGDFCLANFETSPVNEVEPGYYSEESDRHKRHRIKRFAEYADRIYALNPDLLRVLPSRAEFLPYCHVDLREWNPSVPQTPSPTPVILHAPTYRGGKGTRFVLDAISRLRAEGVPMEFTVVEGTPYGEVREIYRRADLLVDQLLSGWYGGLSVELMALGKPVICYIREEDLGFIPKEMQKELPIINASPQTIHDVLKKWLTERKDELPQIGLRSRAYVQRWHNPLKIAAKLKSDYETILALR